jgi:hypothetical protein
VPAAPKLKTAKVKDIQALAAMDVMPVFHSDDAALALPVGVADRKRLLDAMLAAADAHVRGLCARRPVDMVPAAFGVWTTEDTLDLAVGYDTPDECDRIVAALVAAHGRLVRPRRFLLQLEGWPPVGLYVGAQAFVDYVERGARAAKAAYSEEGHALWIRGYRHAQRQRQGLAYRLEYYRRFIPAMANVDGRLVIPRTFADRSL